MSTQTIVSTVFSPVTVGECAICEQPASWKYIKGPIVIDGDAVPQDWRDEDGELWCERCRKLYDLEKLLEEVEGLEKELAI